MDSRDLRSLQEAYNQVATGRKAVGYSSANQDRLVVTMNEHAVLNVLERSWDRVFTGGSPAPFQQLDEVETKETAEGTKYKVRVKDRTSGSSYVRFATREKIAELRANPNIASVELTDETPSNATASGTTGKTQTFGAGPNQNRSSGAGYTRPQPVNRPTMSARMASRDRKALS